MKKIVLTAAALATMIGMASVGARAEDHAAAPAADKAAAPAMEHCYGVAKAGKNDCKTDAHSCAGQAAKDGEKNEFVSVPAGLCDKLAGGWLMK